jgi:hypothetical protein
VKIADQGEEREIVRIGASDIGSSDDLKSRLFTPINLARVGIA